MMEERELSLLDLLSQRARRGEPGLRVSRGMRFLRLGVENIFCYRHAELELEEGITVIAGANGSGKSSLLESIFFALYGSRAGPAMGRSLGEILREGAKQGRAWLDFWCEGKQFAIEMGLKRQGDRVVSERESCCLSRDDGAEWQGVEEVAAKVQELLHMDRDDFTHSVYVRQGEIDQLIQAGDEERRGMIDRLLRLERLDRYAARAKEGAQRAVNRRLATLNGQATGLQREVEALEAEELHRERAHLQREINRRQEELELLEQQRVEREEARAALRERLRRLAEAEREAREGKKEWEEKKRRLAEREGERERLQLLLEGLQTGERERRARLAGILGQLELPRDELLASLKRAEAPGDLPVLPQALVETRERLEEFNQEKQRAREGLARLEAELGHLQLQAEKLDAQVYELRSELAEKRERLTTERTRVEELRSAAEEGDSQVEALKSQIEVCNLERDALATYQKAHAAKLDELRQRSGELRGELAVARTKREQVGEQLARTEEMIRAGRCPACGQPVTAETVAGTTAELEERFHELDKTIHKLREELGNLEGELVAAGEEEEALERLVLLRVEVQAKWDRLEERRQGLTQLEERAKELEERLRQTEDALKENEHELATREGEQRKLGQFIKHKAEEQKRAEERLALLEKAHELCGSLIETRTKMEQGEERKREILRNIDELREDLARLERRLRQLAAELGDRGRLEAEEERIQQQIAELARRRAGLQNEQGKLLDRRGVVSSKLERLESLREEHRAVAAELEEIEQVSGEVEQLGQLYRNVKGELRRRNIAAINHYFDSLFRLMDSGESYSRAAVGEGYEIKVGLKDGRWIHPAIMSGGERALINIALRCAIHQVLVKAVRAMPLILDEPTVYLDRARQGRLQFLLEELGSRVGQVIVVSHEEGLVEGADHEYRTEKGRDNVSTVKRIR